MLSGFVKPRSKSPGGISRLWLACADDLASVVYDGADTCSALALAPGISFAEYEFREDCAVYREGVVVEAGAAKIIHELSFDLARMDALSGEALRDLCTYARGGFIAVMETGCGERIMAGISPEWGTEHPLRLASCSGTTGRQPSEFPVRSFALRSEDTTPALVFSGVLP